jgi:hypothetical protein
MEQQAEAYISPYVTATADGASAGGADSIEYTNWH